MNCVVNTSMLDAGKEGQGGAQDACMVHTVAPLLLFQKRRKGALAYVVFDSLWQLSALPM